MTLGDEIRADVMVLPVDSLQRGNPDAPYKVRVTIFSGPDFKSPHISRGGIASNLRAATMRRARIVEACNLLGIPVVTGGMVQEPTSEPLLPPSGEGIYPPLLDE